jgi:O-antigen/teichoic acid export membrane protein
MKLDLGYVCVVGGMGFRALAQMALVILLARNLGASDYGASVAVISVTGFFSTLAGLGASLLHLRDASIFPDGWRESLWKHHKAIWQSQPVLFAVSSLVAWAVVRGQMQVTTLLLLVCGDLLGLPHNDLIVRSFQGRGRYAWMAFAMCALPLLRVCMLLISFIALGKVTLYIWSYVGFLSGLVIFLTVAGRVAGISRGGVPNNASREVLAGLGFAMSSASMRIHADADKAIIARISSMSAAGDYSLAYRLIDAILLPVNGFMERSTRTLFQHGHAGVLESLRKLWLKWLALLALALLSSCVAYLLAPALPFVFGEQYHNSVVMARCLALLPLTTTVWIVMRSTAVTAGHEKLAGLVELIGAGLSVVLGIALVIGYGWLGAALATYATHLAMVVLMITALHFQRKRRVSTG